MSDKANLCGAAICAPRCDKFAANYLALIYLAARRPMAVR
jgi:hypothetical protein